MKTAGTESKFPELTPEMAEKLDATTALVPAGNAIGLTDKQVASLLNNVSGGKNKWSPELIASARELGAWMSVKTTAQVLATKTFDSFLQIDRALKVCLEVAEDKDCESNIRVAAAKNFADITKLTGDLSEIILKLADSAQAKRLDRAGKNLPPTPGVFVTVNQGQSPQVSEANPTKPAIEITSERS